MPVPQHTIIQLSSPTTFTASERIASHPGSNAPVRLTGLDDAGEPFLSGGRVLRGLFPGCAAAVREVLAICEANDLFRYGIVPTRELREDPHPELGYEAVLEHDRVPFITYPHEWPASMLREAALFHVSLFERLHDYGLTLKDWHPWNILFDATTPVFVDFTSIIPIDSLPLQEYLSRGPRPRAGSSLDAASIAVREMHRLMFEPYFGLPLAMMQQGRHAEARTRIFETTLNAAESVISRSEAFAGDRAARLRYEIEDRFLRATMSERGTRKRKFFARIRKSIDDMNVAVAGSAYSTYYEEKSEAFAAEPVPEWTNKQHVVHDAILRFAPRTLLDLGSNTGWFSMLAAKLGCTVVAVDVDEACIDRLYHTAKREALPILPLVVNLTAPLPERHPRAYADEPSRSLLGSQSPLISSPVGRLRCDMVLALAVVHHLALGQALSFDRIASILGDLAERYLCVEFVAIDDRMIAGDPSFFPAYDAARSEFGWYTEDNFITSLREHFQAVEVLPSYPDSRTLLICSK